MNKEPVRFSFNAMGGESEVQFIPIASIKREKVSQSVIAEAQRIEQKYSRYNPDSLLSRINASAGTSGVKVDSETAGLLDYADACWRQSDGLFDITSGVFRRVWRFNHNVLPTQEQIRSLLPMVGWQKVLWKNPMICLPENMELDFGGIGKEYSVDRIGALLNKHGLHDWLVNFSGDIRISGHRAGDKPWNVGVADPRDGKNILVSVEVNSGGIATSGDYERAIIVDGKRYSHILNPKTGGPVHGLQSVTVFAESCLVAGSITTTAMLHGKKGILYLQDIGVPYLAVTSGGAIKYSKLLVNEESGTLRVEPDRRL